MLPHYLLSVPIARPLLLLCRSGEEQACLQSETRVHCIVVLAHALIIIIKHRLVSTCVICKWVDGIQHLLARTRIISCMHRSVGLRSSLMSSTCEAEDNSTTRIARFAVPAVGVLNEDMQDLGRRMLLLAAVVLIVTIICKSMCCCHVAMAQARIVSASASVEFRR